MSDKYRIKLQVRIKREEQRKLHQEAKKILESKKAYDNNSKKDQQELNEIKKYLIKKREQSKCLNDNDSESST